MSAVVVVPWGLTTALAYIRGLQPAMMDAGWCVFLGGGVLNNGHSPNDLDLLLYPRDRRSERAAAMALLPADGSMGCSPVSDVYAYAVEGRRVEVIFQTWIPDVV